jgi:hypothetical protein
LTALNLDALARRTGLVRRRPKKVHPLSFLQTCCLLATQRNVSLAGWASLWGMLTTSTWSKPAVAKRCSAGAVDFLRLVLQTVLAGLWRPPANVPKALQSFRRVLIQDSTTLALASKLAARFPGSRNQWQKDMASLKIQVICDLLSETFVHFALTPFTTNDQKASPMILDLARPGDLVIRDLGCAVLSVFQRAQAQGLYFLSRLRYGTARFDPLTGQPLALLQRLRTEGRCDTQVWLGTHEKIPVLGGRAGARSGGRRAAAQSPGQSGPATPSPPGVFGVVGLGHFHHQRQRRGLDGHHRRGRLRGALAH